MSHGNALIAHAQKKIQMPWLEIVGGGARVGVAIENVENETAMMTALDNGVGGVVMRSFISKMRTSAKGLAAI